MSPNDPQLITTDAAGMSLREMIKIVRDHLWLIVAATLVFTVAGMVYASIITPIYQATATVLLDSRKKNIIELDSVVSGLRNNTPTIESEVEIVLTSRIANSVITNLGLQADPEFGAYVETAGKQLTKNDNSDGGKDQGRLGDETTQNKAAQGEIVRAPLELAADILRSNLYVRRVRNTYLIEISYTSIDPRKAAKIANEIARAYLNDQVKSKMDTAQLANDWLKQRLDQLRLNVARSERAIEEFKSRNDLLETDGQRFEDRTLTQLMQQMVLARAKRAEAAAQYAQIKKILETPSDKGNLQGVLKSQTIQVLKGQLARTTARQAEMRTRYGARHPEIKKITAEVADISRQLDNEINSIVSNLRNEHQIAEDQLKTLEDGVAAATQKASANNTVALRLGELKRQAKANRDVYNHFLMRYKQTAEQTGLQLPDGRLAQTAAVPQYPIAPRKTRITAIFALAGLALAFAFAFGREFMSTGIKTPEELERKFALPHLASLPDIASIKNDPKGALKALRINIIDPSGTYAEAVRNLRTAIDGDYTRTLNPSNAVGRIVMVTSTLANEGKTSLASNLAQNFAASGLKVLLIDADIRQPELTIQTLPHRKSGLLDCLQQRLPLTNAIQFDRTSGVHFLPAASLEMDIASGADLLLSPMTGTALTSLKSHFDVIIIDSAPILPVADTRMLADFVDQIIFAVRWRKTPNQLTNRALRNLSGNLHKITGMVLSRTEARDHPSYSAYANDRSKQRRAA